jgi:hypothetical protein
VLAPRVAVEVSLCSEEIALRDSERRVLGGESIARGECLSLGRVGTCVLVVFLGLRSEEGVSVSCGA